MKRLLITGFFALVAEISFVHCGTEGGTNSIVPGANGGDGGIAPIINRFEVAATSLPLGGGRVTLSWEVTGADSVSIDPGIGSVTSAGSRNVDVTMTTEFRLTARGPGGSSSATASVSVSTTQRVSGKFVDYLGHAVGSAPILVQSGSFSARTSTDSSGTFTVSDVPVPYDVTAIVGADKTAIVYKGLRRADPTIVNTQTLIPNVYQATITGRVTGWAPRACDLAQPLCDAALIQFTSPEARTSFASLGGDGSYSITVQWGGSSPSITGTLDAIWYRYRVFDSTFVPTQYVAHGSKANITLSSLGTLTGQNFGFTFLDNRRITGTISLPSGYTLQYKRLFLTVANRDINLHGSLFPFLDANVNYVTPVVEGGLIGLYASASVPSGASSERSRRGLSPDAMNVAMPLPSATTLGAPAADAAGVNTGTSFSWTAVAGAVHLFRAYSMGNPSFYVLTSGNSANIPDLASVQLGLPASTSYRWDVQTYQPFASVDAAAAPPNGLLFERGQDIGRTTSASRAFRTVP